MAMQLITHKKTSSGVSRSEIYELVILLRSGLQSKDAVSEVASIASFISTRSFGNMLASEYWGSRPLSYEMSGNKRAHYYYFAFEINPSMISSIKEKLGNNMNIIRHLILKSSFTAKHLSSNQSIMMKNLPADMEKEMGEIQWNESYVFKV